MSFLSPSQAAVPEAKVEGAPPPVLAPSGRKPGNKNQRTTFLGADATANPAQVGSASGNSGGKTLLGS